MTAWPWRALLALLREAQRLADAAAWRLVVAGYGDTRLCRWLLRWPGRWRARAMQAAGLLGRQDRRAAR